jgi:F-type H+-transporting ATPase subunit a
MKEHHGINFIEKVADTMQLPILEPILSAGLVAMFLIVVGKIAVRQLQFASDPAIPESTLSLRGIFDLLFSSLLSLFDSIVGKTNRRYFPFVASLFCYVLLMNLFGLLPGFSAPTDNVSINVGLAVLVFLLYNFWGIREVGFLNFIKHLSFWNELKDLRKGPAIVLPLIFLIGTSLSLFLFCLEILSNVIRPVTLTARLFGNMTADHAMLQAFTELVPLGIPVIFYGLGTLTCFIQAFVFTVLTMVYISLAVAHIDDGEGHH